MDKLGHEHDLTYMTYENEDVNISSDGYDVISP
jgi:hypothetical protein